MVSANFCPECIAAVRENPRRDDCEEDWQLCYLCERFFSDDEIVAGLSAMLSTLGLSLSMAVPNAVLAAMAARMQEVLALREDGRRVRLDALELAEARPGDPHSCN